MWLANVDWWSKTYITWWGSRLTVAWKAVSIVVAMWIAMALFLPSGILDYFGVMYN